MQNERESVCMCACVNVRVRVNHSGLKGVQAQLTGIKNLAKVCNSGEGLVQQVFDTS